MAYPRPHIIDTRIVKIEYKNYDLLSRYWNGQYRGRIWKNKIIVAEHEGTDIDEIMKILMHLVDKFRERELITRQLDAFTLQDHICAWQGILSKCSDNVISALSKHCSSKKHTASIGNLIKAGNYLDESLLLADYKMVEKRLVVEILQDLYPVNTTLEKLYHQPVYDSQLKLSQRRWVLPSIWALSFQQAKNNPSMSIFNPAIPSDIVS